MTEPPAEILRRLRPIPTYVGQPTTVPHDLEGVTPEGAPVRIEIVGAPTPTVLVFLSAACLGCEDLWEGLGPMYSDLDATARLIAVTRGPDEEGPAGVARLAGPDPDRRAAPVVMSSRAFADYRVSGPPFLVVVDAERVRTESVAWGVEQTLALARAALGGR